jgi:hypothetical protein
VVVTRDRVISVVIGIAAFGFAHALVTGSWLRATFAPNPMFRPWFTNSTAAVLLTAGMVAFAAFAFALAAGERRAALTRGITVGAGAIVGMFAVTLQMGIGTLGPIAFLVGAVVLIAAGTAGGGTAAAMKRS